MHNGSSAVKASAEGEIRWEQAKRHGAGWGQDAEHGQEYEQQDTRGGQDDIDRYVCPCPAGA